jgi:hypothetical protein
MSPNKKRNPPKKLFADGGEGAGDGGGSAAVSHEMVMLIVLGFLL